MSKLFSSITIKDMTLKNRIVMPPMCMYSGDNDGNTSQWHYTHYVTRAVGGTALIIQEATAVEPRGRISDADLGIWKDSHIGGLKKIVEGCKANGAKIGIQLAHAGRKCTVASEEIIAPSAIAFDENSRVPREMTKEEIRDVVEAFSKAAGRAKEAGYDVIEIHAAHGYLINEFLSPLTNKRTDEYGGSLENRVRILKETIKAVRGVWPMEKPLIVRVSAEDYQEGGNHPEDIAQIINLVKDEGVDIINVSSGAVVPARIEAYPGYQINFAKIIKDMTSLVVMGGGLVYTPELAEEMLQNKRVDLVYLGRALLRKPYWPLEAAYTLKEEIVWPKQYDRGKF